ncbi:MAG: BMP family ABC transporter substrate-binding protein [Syntrophobacteraceae bacterium]|nr:BMP family ABC transporter substrate-binding protein [Syntrophobacteraceae bacterium]
MPLKGMTSCKALPPGRFFSRVFAAVVFFLMLLPPPAACAAKTMKVVVLTDASGLGDKGFNDVSWKGVQRAQADFHLKAQFVQSREQADYVANLSMASKFADIVVTLGYLYTDAVRQVAPYFPDTFFIHIEGEVSGDHVASYDFKSEEGGFLAGLAAGLFTKKRRVGVVTGMDIPPVEAYVSGFRAGVKTAEKYRNEPVEIIIVSAGSFNDPVKGKSLAQALVARGVDVIFRAAGNTGVGVNETVRNTEGVYLIAEDLDQDADIPGKILASTLKRMDVAVYDAIRDIVQGNFKSGHHWLGAAEGAMDITDMEYSKHLFSSNDLLLIRNARRVLKDGSRGIPKRHNEVDGFQPPDLKAATD